MNTVSERIRSFLARYPGGAALADRQDIFASGVLTSLLAMQLVLFVEKEFRITVANEDLELANFATIEALAAFVARKQS